MEFGSAVAGTMDIGTMVPGAAVIGTMVPGTAENGSAAIGIMVTGAAVPGTVVIGIVVPGTAENGAVVIGAVVIGIVVPGTAENGMTELGMTDSSITMCWALGVFITGAPLAVFRPILPYRYYIIRMRAGPLGPALFVYGGAAQYELYQFDPDNITFIGLSWACTIECGPYGPFCSIYLYTIIKVI